MALVGKKTGLDGSEGEIRGEGLKWLEVTKKTKWATKLRMWESLEGYGEEEGIELYEIRKR